MPPHRLLLTGAGSNFTLLLPVPPPGVSLDELERWLPKRDGNNLLINAAYLTVCVCVDVNGELGVEVITGVYGLVLQYCLGFFAGCERRPWELVFVAPRRQVRSNLQRFMQHSPISILCLPPITVQPQELAAAGVVQTAGGSKVNITAGSGGLLAANWVGTAFNGSIVPVAVPVEQVRRLGPLA